MKVNVNAILIAIFVLSGMLVVNLNNEIKDLKEQINEQQIRFERLRPVDTAIVRGIQNNTYYLNAVIDSLDLKFVQPDSN